MVAPMRITALQLLLAVGLTMSDDSIEACLDKLAGADCIFRLPTVDDNFKAPDSGTGALQSGICQIRSGTQKYCRAVPSQEAHDICTGKATGSNCTYQTVGRDTWLSVEAFTSRQARSDTTGAVYASFEIAGSWTHPELFFKGMGVGQAKKKTFRVAAWPSKMALTLHSNDAWSFWKIDINDHVIVVDHGGKKGSQEYMSYHPPMLVTDSKEFASTRYWLEGPPASQFFSISSYGTGDDQCGGSSMCSISLKAHTSMATRAETTGCISVQFLVGGTWTKATEGDEFFCSANLGEVKTKSFTVAAWPTRLWIGVGSTDSWGFWKLTVNDLDVLVDPAGQEGQDKEEYLGSRISDTSFWLEAPPRTQSFIILPSIQLNPQPVGTAKAFEIHGACNKAWTDVLFCDDGAYVDKASGAVVTKNGTANRVFFGQGDAPVNDPACCAQYTEWPNVDKWVTCGSCAALVKTTPHNSCKNYCNSFGHICAGAAEEVGEQCAVLSVEKCEDPILGWGLTSDMLCACRYVASVPSCAQLPGMADSMSFVYMEFVVRGLIHATLTNSSSLVAAFNEAVKGAIVSSVGRGLTSHHVKHLWMEPGSVTVFTILNLPPTALVVDVMNSLRTSAPALVEAVKNVNGIAFATSGAISIAIGKMETWNNEDLVEMERIQNAKEILERQNGGTPAPTTVENFMPLEPERVASYKDIDDEDNESDAILEVGGSHAVLIIVIASLGTFCLAAAVVCLLCKVKRLRQQLREKPVNQAVAYNNDVAVGRPVAAQAENAAGPDNAVSGTVVVAADTPDPENSKATI